jgi:transcriptional regulator with XRE-family HTH domain
MLTPETIKLIRKNLELTQGELARMAGISASQVSSIERRDRPLLPDVAEKIRRAIDLTDEQILELIEVNKKLKNRR